MKKILEHKVVLMVFLGILFVHLFLFGFHFYSEIEIPDVAIDPIVLPGEEDLEFQNNSSMSNHEVTDLLKQKKAELRNLFYEIPVYRLSDVDSSRSPLEDDQYYVFDETFLKRLDDLVISSIYQRFYEQLTLLSTADSAHIYYVAKRSIFDEVHFDSIVAEVGILSSKTRLILVTDEIINASVTISACQNILECSENRIVPIELQKINDESKVSAFL